jgi:hypothetical protein
MEEMTMNMKNLKDAQDMQKIYVDMNMVFRYFKFGEHVFLKVKAKISSVRLGF